MKGLARLVTLFSSTEISLLLRSSRRALNLSGITIKIAPTSLAYGRILVITPAKSGSAPQRNLFRRRCKSIFYQEELYKRKINCIVWLRKEGANYSYDELKALLMQALKAHG